MPASSCSAIFLKEIAPSLKRQSAEVRDARGVFEFRIDGPEGGTWTIDCNIQPPTVFVGEAENPDVVVEMSDEDFVSFYRGELGGFSAFLNGRVRVKGNMQLAMKMGRLISQIL